MSFLLIIMPIILILPFLVTNKVKNQAGKLIKYYMVILDIPNQGGISCYLELHQLLMLHVLSIAQTCR